MPSLVGQIIIHSTRNNLDGYDFRKILILEEYFTDTKQRRYKAQELPGKKLLDCCAVTYDRLFLAPKGQIRTSRAFKGEEIRKLRLN